MKKRVLFFPGNPQFGRQAMILPIPFNCNLQHPEVRQKKIPRAIRMIQDPFDRHGSFAAGPQGFGAAGPQGFHPAVLLSSPPFLESNTTILEAWTHGHAVILPVW